MSKARSRNSLLSSSNRAQFGNSTQDELLKLKFSMEKPDIGLYPLNDLDNGVDLNGDNLRSQHTAGSGVLSGNEVTYPDYKPWKDHTALPNDKKEQEHQKLNNAAYLNKGYFETPVVANEYYSARNLIQATVFSSTENCNEVLKELSQHLANAYKTRNEIINKIKYESNNFKIPPRVTLTASKKESWLKDLANPDLALSKIAEKIPHGMRNKILIDAVCNKSVPINRALWFTKCVLFGELVALRRKHQSRMSLNSPIPQSLDINTPEKFEIHWLQEWTQQVADYIYKFSKESSNFNTIERKQYYMNKMTYLLTYIQALYVEFLLDKSFFLALIIKFLKEGLPLDPLHVSELLSSTRSESDDLIQESWIEDLDLNYGQRLFALTLIKIFWNDILKFDYICKELSETLLLNYLFISKINAYSFKQSHVQNHKASIPEPLRQKILDMIGDTITYLFKFNTNVFIIPNYWMLINGVLFTILLNKNVTKTEGELDEISKQFDLIKYRNESLILNMRNVQPSITDRATPNSAGRRGSSIWNQSFVSAAESTATKIDIFDNEATFINRSSDDILKIISQLDSLKLNDELANFLKPVTSSSALTSTAIKGCPKWRTNLKVVLYWCITRHRNSRESSEDILIICNFLKRKVLQTLGPTRSSSQLKAEFESEILDIIYNIADTNSSKVVNYDLYVLINELYQLKVLTIASYLRKLIASGIFYVAPDAEDNILNDNSNSLVKTHLSILQNLPVINNRQCDSILKKWTSTGFNFKEKFEMGQEILKRELIDRIVNNTFDDQFESHIVYVKDLNVGLKFLLVNWVTNELKSAITESPKLIHINPLIISNLFNFYSICDNLTVFFKVLVKFILKNEGGMIIFYLESLYLIARLIIKHFKLVKFIAGNSYGSNSTAYELFKLIIQNYKDCKTREFDYFKFDQVWNFIDTAVESNYSSDKNTDSRSSGKRSGIFNKEQFDSPMKINTSENVIAKMEDRYTSADFRNDLDLLLESTFQPMDSNEVSEVVATLKLEFEENEMKSHRNVVPKVLDLLKSNLTEESEGLAAKLLINSQYLIKSDDVNAFDKLVQDYILELVKSDMEILLVAKFLKKLIVHEIIRINDLFAFFEPIAEDPAFRVKLKALMFDLVIGLSDEEREYLSNSQILQLEIMRQWYRERSTSSFLVLILKGIKTIEGSIFDCPLMEKYGSSIFRILNALIVANTKLLSDELISKISTEDSIRLLSTLNNENFTPINSLQDLERIASEVDEFNLPIFQLLLRVLTIKELSPLQENEIQERLKVLLESFLENLSFGFTPMNSYFGELFIYLPWEYVVSILGMLEDKFLCSTTFNFDQWDNDKSVLSLTNSVGNTNLLPVFNDYFKKFSSSSSNVVESSSSFFQALSKFLSKLLLIVNSDNCLEDTFEDTSSAISIFLRILIIHKLTLTRLIVTQDGEQFQFIKNLILLINSKFIAEGNEKLRILLYDLLLLMKSSVTEEVSKQTENELSEGTSPGFGMTAQSPPPVEDASKITEPLSSARPSSEAASFQTNPISTYDQVSSLFNLPEPTETNPFKDYITEDRVECALTLSEDELQSGGDIHGFNESNLVLISSSNDSTFSGAFALITNPHQRPKGQPFKLRSFEILEGTSTTSLNDGCINLQLFDSYTTKENPP
ncbi:hypothetical protein G9P44_005424 [Scheffersomyces stipitis]|nr:hypothetical protein G9P44_005424 [Scheffersomyces stipitis]